MKIKVLLMFFTISILFPGRKQAGVEAISRTASDEVYLVTHLSKGGFYEKVSKILDFIDRHHLPAFRLFRYGRDIGCQRREWTEYRYRSGKYADSIGLGCIAGRL